MSLLEAPEQLTQYFIDNMSTMYTLPTGDDAKKYARELLYIYSCSIRRVLIKMPIENFRTSIISVFSSACQGALSVWKAYSQRVGTLDSFAARVVMYRWESRLMSILKDMCKDNDLPIDVHTTVNQTDIDNSIKVVNFRVQTYQRAIDNKRRRIMHT